MYVQFSGSCLRQDKITFKYIYIANIYIVYDLKPNLNNFDLTLKNCLFGAIKLTKYSDIDKYEYAVYKIGFDSKGTFRHPSGGTGVNVVIFGVGMSSGIHVNNKTKNILILGEGFTKCIQLILLELEKNFCLILHYNGDNSYLFVNGTKMVKFKAKYSEIVANPMCLGNISEDVSSANTKKTGLYGSVFDVSVNYRVTAVDDILDIHKYLMKKNCL